MNQNPHWKQLIWNWASIIFGNALYSLTVALFLEPADSSPAARPASHWPSGD